MKDSKILQDNEVMFVFDEFIKMRISIKKRPTPHAINLLLEKLIKLSGDNSEIATEMLNRSIISNWLDIYALKEEVNGSISSHISANQKAKDL